MAEVTFLDWVIDGTSLRDRFDAATEMTLLQDEKWMRPHRTESIARLRGEVTGPPAYRPQFRRTTLDRLLGRQGTPVARFGAAFDDGRVGLLFCVCGDIDCPILSAEVVVAGGVVQWRDIGWQVGHAPFGGEGPAEQDEGVCATFELREYESLMRSLLHR